MDESIAVCKFQFVLRHESGTSIQPRGLSIAITERSSKMMGIGSQRGSSMKWGLAIRAIITAEVNRLKLFSPDQNPAAPAECLRPRSSDYSNDRSEEHTSELQSPCNLVC